MRILYVSHTHPSAGAILDNVGGMQRVSRQLVDELHQRNDIELFTETVNVSGEGLVALKTTRFLVRSLISLPRKVRQTDVDVVLFSSMVTATLAWFLRNRIDVPMVTINHGRDVTLEVGIYQAFLPRVFAALDGVISVSRATRQECIKRGMDSEMGIALANGFNLDAMKNLPEKQPSRSALKKEFGIPLDDKIMLLTVGRKVKRKGHEWFVREVLPKITAEVVYVTVGDGPQFEEIENSVNQTGQNNQVFLLGRQPDSLLKKAYSAADLFIMPNIPVEGDMEGFGIVLLEANMARTPAVAADLEGIKDVISDGKNGYKVPAQNAEKFSVIINRLLKNDHDLAQLSNRAREYVEQQFAWKRVADKYIDYLKSVIGQYKRPESKK